MLVVFFKQKTAYEMRISDWSPDVCSSDLRDRPALRLIGIASDEKKRTAGGVHLLRGEHPPDGVGVTIRRLADLDLLVVILGEGERARRLKRQLVLGDQVDQRGCERGKAKHLVDERSEEHTSELQSLMRISYAVFCLKKKKTCKSPIHQTIP